MLFESSYWAGTVIKLLMTTLFFISELIFREITWWWTKPEWWPGRQNFHFWNKGCILQWFWIFRGNSLRLLSSVAQSPEHSLQAIGGWRRLVRVVEAGGGWKRLVAGHLTRSATFVATLQVWGWGSPERCHNFTEDTQFPNQVKPAPGIPGRSLPTYDSQSSHWLHGVRLLSSAALRRIWPTSVSFLSRKYTSLSGTRTKFTAMMSKRTHQ